MGEDKSGAAAETVLAKGVEKNNAAIAIAKNFLEFFNMDIPSFVESNWHISSLLSIL